MSHLIMLVLDGTYDPTTCHTCGVLRMWTRLLRSTGYPALVTLDVTPCHVGI